MADTSLSAVCQSPKGQMQAHGELLSFWIIVGVEIVGSKNKARLREGGEEEKEKRT